MSLEQEFGALVGRVIAYGGGGAVIAYLIFRFLATSWIENKFSEKLEAYKHAQSKELEDVRFRINSIFNRLSKLHDKEFEVLPNAWGKLNQAYQAIMRCVMSYREFPDLDRLDNIELDEFLSGTTLSESSKRKIRDSTQKVRTYGDIMSWVDINDAHKAFFEFHSYIVANRIFLRSDLKNKFDAVDDLMWKMWVSHKVGKDSGNYRLQYEEFQKNDPTIKSLMAEIENLVQGRLQPVE